jgi:transposase
MRLQVAFSRRPMGPDSGAFSREEHVPDTCPGHKPLSARHLLEGVLRILNAGAQLHMLPQCYLNYKTMHRQFQQECQCEMLREILTQFGHHAT